EDAVAPPRKQEARAALAAWLGASAFATANAQHPKKIIVRVNAADTPDYPADLAARRGLPIDVLNLPKVESAAALRAAIDEA
ncbi:aldolase/citrate lyase family protein, partial [Salmonella enterica]|nr:aldolase/citrate lyase family protein [Salmonella enterica]